MVRKFEFKTKKIHFFTAIPYGLIKFPFFETGLKWVNRSLQCNNISNSGNFCRVFDYAGIGTIIGHELAHGIDTEGILFDSDGFYQQILTKREQAIFDKYITCLTNQYRSFYKPNV